MTLAPREKEREGRTCGRSSGREGEWVREGERVCVGEREREWVRERVRVSVGEGVCAREVQCL